VNVLMWTKADVPKEPRTAHGRGKLTGVLTKVFGEGLTT
jgi:hypothetical protein